MAVEELAQELDVAAGEQKKAPGRAHDAAAT